MNGLILRALVIAMAAVLATAAQAQDAKRSISKIAGDLYRFQNNFHYSVFLVTDEGIIVTDPINPDAARWLKAELAKRFNKPVKYLIYSHDHADHSSGGEVFADTAVVVGHANTKRTMLGEKRPTVAPSVTFADSMTVELGGKTVELRYVGRNQSDNMIVMNFPAERALFAVDFIPVKTLAFRDLPDAYVPDWIDSLKRVEAMDFDVLVPGHGPIGNKTDVTAYREYMEDLHSAVLAASRAGKSLDEMKASITLDKYKDWAQYEAWRALNIEGMHRHVSLHRRGN